MGMPQVVKTEGREVSLLDDPRKCMGRRVRVYRAAIGVGGHVIRLLPTSAAVPQPFFQHLFNCGTSGDRSSRSPAASPELRAELRLAPQRREIFILRGHPATFSVSSYGPLQPLQRLIVAFRYLAGMEKGLLARDIISRWDVVEVRTRATANTATDFLSSLQARMPFPVRAIQVDGGSEFQAGFEQACQQRNIRLFVLPPRSPKLNGCVERAQRTHTEEFYEVNDFPLEIAALNQELRLWEHTYNTVRPHQALGYLTPSAFWQLWVSQHPPDKENGTAGTAPGVPSPPYRPTIPQPTPKEARCH